MFIVFQFLPHDEKLLCITHVQHPLIPTYKNHDTAILVPKVNEKHTKLDIPNDTNLQWKIWFKS